MPTAFVPSTTIHPRLEEMCEAATAPGAKKFLLFPKWCR